MSLKWFSLHTVYYTVFDSQHRLISVKPFSLPGSFELSSSTTLPNDSNLTPRVLKSLTLHGTHLKDNPNCLECEIGMMGNGWGAFWDRKRIWDESGAEGRWTLWLYVVDISQTQRLKKTAESSHVDYYIFVLFGRGEKSWVTVSGEDCRSDYTPESAGWLQCVIKVYLLSSNCFWWFTRISW